MHIRASTAKASAVRKAPARPAPASHLKTVPTAPAPASAVAIAAAAAAAKVAATTAALPPAKPTQKVCNAAEWRTLLLVTSTKAPSVANVPLATASEVGASVGVPDNTTGASLQKPTASTAPPIKPAVAPTWTNPRTAVPSQPESAIAKPVAAVAPSVTVSYCDDHKCTKEAQPTVVTPESPATVPTKSESECRSEPNIQNGRYITRQDGSKCTVYTGCSRSYRANCESRGSSSRHHCKCSRDGDSP